MQHTITTTTDHQDRADFWRIQGEVLGASFGFTSATAQQPCMGIDWIEEEGH